ncbi:MAG TPA: hypothetical protein VGK67_33355 [Myxococcales bacterium]
MICFELSINGKRMTRAGIPGFAVLTSCLTWVNRKPKPGSRAVDHDLSISMTGLDSNGPSWESGTHVGWIGKKLKAGDVVQLRILDADKVDPPKSSEPRMSKAKLDAMKRKSHRYYLALYKKQRSELDEQIAFIEREVNAARPSRRDAASRMKTSR